MGILNVTPDSFFDGGRHPTLEAARTHAGKMVGEGAAILDVGGQSTRPGHVEVSLEEEQARVVPIIRALAADFPEIPLSIDSYRPEVVEAALAAGARIVNDVRGLQGDPRMAEVVAAGGSPVIVMHNDPDLRDLVGDPLPRVLDFLGHSLEIADRAGIDRDRIVLDPGIGFGKTQEQNLVLLGRLPELRILGCPLLLGASRKSVIHHVLNLPVDERLEGTLALTSLAAWHGIEIIRVHDVRANLRAARMASALRRVL